MGVMNLHEYDYNEWQWLRLRLIKMEVRNQGQWMVIEKVGSIL